MEKLSKLELAGQVSSIPDTIHIGKYKKQITGHINITLSIPCKFNVNAKDVEYEDEFVEQTKTLGYIYDEAEDAIYLHKGVDINYIVKLLGECNIVNQTYDKYLPMKFEYEEIVSPRNDEQRDVINFIAGLQHFSNNRNFRQLFLVKKPGFG